MQAQRQTKDWCLPLRNGTRRYEATVQDLYWRYESMLTRIDQDSACIRKRLDNSKRLQEFCDQTPANASENNDALCRLLRHYALYLSLYRVISLSLSTLWREVLLVYSSFSDLPIAIPNQKDSSAESLEYYSEIYAPLEQLLTAECFERFAAHLDKCNTWLSLLAQTLTVDSLENNLRVEIALSSKENVLERLRVIQGSLSAIQQRFDDFAKNTCKVGDMNQYLADMTKTENSGDRLRLISPTRVGNAEKNVTIEIALPRAFESNTKTLGTGYQRLDESLQHIGKVKL